MFFKNFKSVFVRELRQMFSRPIYIFATVGVVLFCCLFFLTFFKEGIPERLPIGIVDHDNSAITRRVRREMDALQGVRVEAYYATFAEAREAMQQGKIYGIVEMPENMYDDILANRRPEIGVYANTAYLVAGTLSYRQMMTMANLASGAYQREVLRKKGVTDDKIMGMIQPIVIDQHLIGNPESDYGVYLLNLLLPGIIELMILMITIFAIGYELKSGTSREWLSAGGNSMAAAMAGKIAPYTILFVVIGWFCDILLYKFMHYPLAGSLGNMMILMLLFVLATQAVAIFMIGLFPVLREGVCFAALYGVLAFSFAGFTFPIESMPAWLQGWAELFPLRHYFLFYSKEAIFATGIGGWWLQAVCLLLFLTLPFMVYRRLFGAMYYQQYPKM